MGHNDGNVGLGLLSYFRGSEVWIKPSTMRSLVSGAGLAIKIPDLRPSKAARAARAANHFSNTKIKVNLIGKQPSRFDTSAAFSVTRLVKEPGRKAEYLAFDTVRWDEKAGWSSDKGTDEAKAFIGYAERWQTHLDYSWVRNLALTGLAEAKAISLPGGGVYYVHTDDLGTFRSWQALIAQIPGARMMAVQVDGADGETRDTIADAAETSLGEQIGAVLTRLREWQDKAQGQKGTILKMLDEITDTRARAHALSVGLGFQVDALNAELDAVQDLLNAELGNFPAPSAGGGTTSGRAPGGAILDAIIAAYGLLGRDEATVAELAETCEREGLLTPGANTLVRTMVSGRLSDARENGDPRFEKLGRGRYRYSADGTHSAADEPSDEAPPAATPDATDDPMNHPLADESGCEIEEGPEVLSAPTSGGDDEWYEEADWNTIPADIDEQEDWVVRTYADANGVPSEGDVDLMVERLIELREQRLAS